MAGSTNFKQFNPNKSNMTDDTTYTNSDYRVNGCRTGLAPSAVHNKLFYQLSTFVSAYAKMLANKGFIVNDNDFDTLVNVLSGIGSSGLQRKVFTANGTFEVPIGMTQVFLSGCAGGAGGTAVYGNGGGGGESCSLFPVNVDGGSTITVTIGAGGNGGIGFSQAPYNSATMPFSTATGTSGTNTMFGSLKTLTGGKVAVVDASHDNLGMAGGPGATHGDFPAVYGDGYPWNASTPTMNRDRKGGQGGSSLFGVGGTGGNNVGAMSIEGQTMNGQDGQGYGAGGGGGGEAKYLTANTYACSNGGNGSNGILIVEWYA